MSSSPAANAGTRAVPRLAVFGSCVSRDAIERFEKGSYDLRRYVARQSVISVGRDASEHLPERLDLKHAFQERMVRGDWRGDLWEQLDAAGDVDALLWDLTDERHGVCVYLDGGVATRSVDALSSRPLSDALSQGWHVRFGSDGHFEAWAAAATQFGAELDKRGRRADVIVVKVPWAERGSQGETVPSSMGLEPREANRLYARYYEHLERSGFDILSVETEPLADPNHRWGLAPFHFVPQVYDEICDGVLDRVRRRRTSVS